MKQSTANIFPFFLNQRLKGSKIYIHNTGKDTTFWENQILGVLPISTGQTVAFFNTAITLYSIETSVYQHISLNYTILQKLFFLVLQGFQCEMPLQK